MIAYANFYFIQYQRYLEKEIFIIMVALLFLLSEKLVTWVLVLIKMLKIGIMIPVWSFNSFLNMVYLVNSHSIFFLIILRKFF